jgi:hypothetical protein
MILARRAGNGRASARHDDRTALRVALRAARRSVARRAISISYVLEEFC